MRGSLCMLPAETWERSRPNGQPVRQHESTTNVSSRSWDILGASSNRQTDRRRSHSFHVDVGPGEARLNNSYERKHEQIRIGTIVRNMREERGLSQQHLADAIHLHRTTVGRIEHGEYDLGISHLPALARALGQDLQAFCHTLATFKLDTPNPHSPISARDE